MNGKNYQVGDKVEVRSFIEGVAREVRGTVNWIGSSFRGETYVEVKYPYRIRTSNSDDSREMVCERIERFPVDYIKRVNN